MRTIKATTPNLERKARETWLQLNNASSVIQVTTPKMDARALAAYMDYFNSQVERHALRLSTGEMTVNQWRLAMAKEIENLHVTGAVIGRGGVDKMDAAALKEVRRTIGNQKQYLDAWAGELTQQRKRGEEFDPAKINNRARLYGGAVNSTVYTSNTAAIGLPRLPQYPGDGHTVCRTNCRCVLRIDKLKGEGDWNIYWILHEDDRNCPDCEALSRQWNPLRVRKGKLV